MKIELSNKNYCGTIVEIKTLIPLENCNNVQAAIIMGNQVIVGNDVKIGDIGIFFPVETQLSKEYLSANNLYRDIELNIDKTKKGYFELSGRIRCVKFRGNKSEGLFMPIESLYFIYDKSGEYPKVNDSFNEFNDVEICKKYVVKQERKSDHVKHQNGKGFKKYETKLIDGQFRFHGDTEQLYKNLHRINPDSLIQISYKLHGTSGVSSYILCKKHNTKLAKFKAFVWNLTNKIENLFRSAQHTFELQESEYDYIYSSRKVIKNSELNPNAQHYYSEDIWGIAHKELEPHLQKGLSLYYEIVGYLPNGGMIQKDYDYGCEVGKHAIYIYRITQTNIDGKVFEFSARQVQDWCKKNGLNAVPELYYGYAKNLVSEIYMDLYYQGVDFKDAFLDIVKKLYNEKNCYLCKNKLPEEGCVIRIEGLELEAFKCKSVAFLERETKHLDKGEIDIESEN